MESPTTDPAIPYRYHREVRFNRAREAIFALEQTLPMDTESRRALYRVRIALQDAWDNGDPEAKAAPFDHAN